MLSHCSLIFCGCVSCAFHQYFWSFPYYAGEGRVVRSCWVNFQCRGVLLIWIRVGQGPTALAVGAGEVCLDIFSLVYYFSFLSPSLWETARYRLKYCLKGPLSPKQPTNHPYYPYLYISLKTNAPSMMSVLSNPLIGHKSPM